MLRFSGIKYAKYLGASLLLSASLLLLSSCTSPDILNDPSFNPPVRWGAHIVREGESLYSIAWRYGRDPAELARSNRISAPYIIHPGQRISLAGDAGSITSDRSGVTAAPSKPRAAGSTTSGSRSSTNYKKKQKATSHVTSARSGSDLKWQWPHSGAIIDTFSATGGVNKGIDIAGKLGDPVLAASQGEVVYAGSGLIGYGPLVIIKHNEDFLSAYAHNRKILVKEGDLVRRGEQITELGDEGSNRPKLHFEIRRRGKPVDPLRYLPRR